MELLDKIAAWISLNLGLIFMGIAGSTITALITPQKRVKDKSISYPPVAIAGQLIIVLTYYTNKPLIFKTH